MFKHLHSLYGSMSLQLQITFIEMKASFFFKSIIQFLFQYSPYSSQKQSMFLDNWKIDNNLFLKVIIWKLLGVPLINHWLMRFPVMSMQITFIFRILYIHDHVINIGQPWILFNKNCKISTGNVVSHAKFTELLRKDTLNFIYRFLAKIKFGHNYFWHLKWLFTTPFSK